jgi:hypothetical protein
MGGAIFNMFGQLYSYDSTLAHNLAQGGASLSNRGGGGAGYGGAVFNLDGSVTLDDDTLAANTVTGGNGLGGAAPGDGGAVYNLSFGVDYNGNAGQAPLTLNDNILSGSQGGNDLANLAYVPVGGSNRAVLQGQANLVRSNTSLLFVADPILGGAFLPTPAPLPAGLVVSTADPQLGPLQNNSGPTPTMAIPASSPAFGAGQLVVLLATDQRGLPRLDAGRLDLGAFEVETTSSTFVLDNAAQLGTFQGNVSTTILGHATVTSGNQPVPGGQVALTLVNTSGATVATSFAFGLINGTTPVTLIAPNGIPAGDYTLRLDYTDPSGAYAGSSSTSRLTVGPAATAIALINLPSIPYGNGAEQTVTLTANVSGGALNVDSGNVTFTVRGFKAATGAVHHGEATADLTVPAGTLPGPYSLTATYTDDVNSDGAKNFSDAESFPAVLTVTPATPVLTLSPASVPYDNVADQTVTVFAHVFSSGRAVTQGSVIFTSPGQLSPLVPVDGTGTASTTLTIPAGTPAGQIPVTLAFLPNGGFHGPGGEPPIGLFNPTSTSSQVTIAPDPVQVTITSSTKVIVTPGSANRTVHLSAHVTTANVLPGDPSGLPAVVPEGSVNFYLLRLSSTGQVLAILGPVAGPVDPSGNVAATWNPPATAQKETYAVVAVYRDGLNGNGLPNYLGGLETANDRFVAFLYVQLTGRLPTLTVLNALAAQLEAGLARDQLVTLVVNSPEVRAGAVQDLYESIFGRVPNPTELAGALDALQQGRTLVQLESDWLIQLSQKKTLDMLSFENTLFQTALGRSPTAQDLSNLAGMSPSAMVNAVLHGPEFYPEFYLHQVDVTFQRFLSRLPSPSERQFFLRLVIPAGGDTTELEIALLSSQEFFALAAVFG